MQTDHYQIAVAGQIAEQRRMKEQGRHERNQPTEEQRARSQAQCEFGIRAAITCCGHSKVALPVQCGLGAAGWPMICIDMSFMTAGIICPIIAACNMCYMIKDKKCYSWVPHCGDKAAQGQSSEVGADSPSSQVSDSGVVTQQPGASVHV